MVTSTVELVRALAERYVAAEGIAVYDVEVLGRGAGTIVRITVQGDEPVGVDRIAALSRGISRLLDEEDPFPGSYTLEVSTPGLERKLRVPAHFEAAVGSQIKVKSRHPVDGTKNHQGELKAVEGDTIVVDIQGGERRIALDDISSARTVFSWGGRAKPGSKQAKP